MDRVEAGQEFDIERVDRADYRLIRRAAPANEGAIDWLLACPRKDFFVRIDSESTDTLRSTWLTPTLSSLGRRHGAEMGGTAGKSSRGRESNAGEGQPYRGDGGCPRLGGRHAKWC
jgi:hypothetical protein